MLSATFICLAADDSDAVNDVTSDVDYAKVGTNVTFTLTGDQNYYYTAVLKNSSGQEQSSAISSSNAKGSLGSDNTKDITVKTPSSAGDYTLTVKYFETTADRDEDKSVETFNLSLKAVEAITLKATVTNSGSSSMELNVYFTMDGKKIDDSAKTITVSAGKSTDVTYEYITKDTRQFEYALEADGYIDESIIKGLGESKTAYTSADDFTYITVILAVVIAILIIAAAFILRKPVVNKGKPRARR